MINFTYIPKFIDETNETYQTHENLIYSMISQIIDAFEKELYQINERVISLNNSIIENMRNYGNEIETLINGEINEWLNTNYDWEQELKTLIKDELYNVLMREKNHHLKEND